jgi:hypothetical protein
MSQASRTIALVLRREAPDQPRALHESEPVDLLDARTRRHAEQFDTDDRAGIDLRHHLVRGGAEEGGAVVDSEMRWQPAGIVRRSGVEIVGTVAERGEYLGRHHDRREEADDAGARQCRVGNGGKLELAVRRQDRKLRIVGVQQRHERVAFGIFGQQDDGVEHDPRPSRAGGAPCRSMRASRS